MRATDKYYIKNRDKIRRRAAKWRATHKRHIRKQSILYYVKNRKRIAKYYIKNRDKILELRSKKSSLLKFEVLSHYGKRGQLLCSWRGCQIVDLDCLTLDHVFDNGKIHRAAGFGGGATACRQLKDANYPNGFQTLCANHQLKKEIQRRRNA